MSRFPPTRLPRSSRHRPSGRSTVTAWLLATILVGCAVRAPERSTRSSEPSPTSPSSEPTELTNEALLIALGGRLQVTTVDGSLVEVDGPDPPIVDVSAGGGRVLAIDARSQAWLGESTTGEPWSWSAVSLPKAPRNEPPLVAISPTGTTLALLVGRAQGSSFDLELVELGSGDRRSITVERGLDGPPIWLGPSVVAVHVIRDRGDSGFVLIDLPTEVATDVFSTGVTLGASGDGASIAIDEETSGDVLVGERSNWREDGLGLLTRIRGPSGAGVDGLALSAAGDRLAIVRRTDVDATVEIIVRAGEGWRSFRTIAIPVGARVSLAWQR